TCRLPLRAFRRRARRQWSGPLVSEQLRSARLARVSINIPQALDRLCYRYPSMLVDAIVEHEPGRRLVAVKNVTISEEFFQGHFPGTPIMPAVLMVESLSQVAAILLLQREDAPPRTRV